MQDKSADVDSWSVLRVSWLVLPVGLVVTTLVCGTTLLMSSPATAAEGYAMAVILHGKQVYTHVRACVRVYLHALIELNH